MTGPPPILTGPPPRLPVPGNKNMLMAGGLNLFLPGAGLFYLGQRAIGAALAGGFLVCFLAELGIFIVCYGRYLSLAMSDDLMKNDNLEQIAVVFPRAWLIAFAGVGLIIYLVSMALFASAKRKLQKPTT